MVMAGSDNRSTQRMYLHTTPHQQAPIQSQIKAFQTRCISIFPDGTGFAIGNIEGRVAIHYMDHKQGE